MFRVRPRRRDRRIVVEEVGLAATPVIDVRDRAVVGDAEQECAFRTLVAKAGQGLPDGEPDLLHEILLFRGIALVARGQPPERTIEFVQQSHAAIVTAFSAHSARQSPRLAKPYTTAIDRRRERSRRVVGLSG